jgi:aspartyl-tRNA synthetase
MEMAFSDGNDVMRRIEVFIHGLFKGLQNDGSIVLPPDVPFHRMTYADAMRRYGSDKPDLRIPDTVSSDLQTLGKFYPNPSRFTRWTR